MSKKKNTNHDAEHEAPVQQTPPLPTDESQKPEIIELQEEHQSEPVVEELPEKRPTRRRSSSSRNKKTEGETEQPAGEELPELMQGGREREEEEHFEIPDVLPVLPLKDTVVYPFSVQPLAVGQERSIRLIDDVMRDDRRLVVLVAQKSADLDLAGPDDIFKTGTVSRVGRMFRMPDGTIQIAVQGLERVDIGEFTQEKPYLKAHVTLKPDV